MASFKDIVGQEHIVKHKKNAIKLNKISHAYLLCGEKGMGKKTLADRFAMLLQCENSDEEPCGECKSCKQALGKNNPDIKWVYHEKPNTISVEEVREQLVNDIAIKPYSSKYKIYIIDESEKMSDAAQNAILKTIEEPPEYGIIILLTENREMMLETIKSRCVLLDAKPVLKSEFKEFMQRKMKVPDYDIDSMYEFSGGNIGKAISMTEQETYSAMREHIINTLKNIDKSDASVINSKVKEAGEFKTEITGYLDLINMWFRDVLLCKATRNANKLIFKEQTQIIKKQAEVCAFDEINLIFEEIKNVSIKFKSNVNFEVTLQMLYVKIRDLLTE